MKDFVKEQVWGRLKHRKDMWCEIKHKPLINLDIYTNDWAFKVVGSVKWQDRAYHQLPTPSKELFLSTRMADRDGIPSFSNIRTSEAPLGGKWVDLMLTAKYLRVFQYPRTIIQKITSKLSSTATNKDIISPKLAVMGATTLCIATLGEEPILTTVFTGQKWKFDKYCWSPETGHLGDAHTQHKEAIARLWNLCTTVLKPVLRALQDKLPKTRETIILYKGLQAPNIHALRKTVEDLKLKLPRAWVWSSSLETAINEATPNEGRKGKLSLIDRRLLRKGHSDLVTNHVGIVLSYKTIAIPIADLTPTATSDEFFAKFGPIPSWDVQTAHNPLKKAQLLCPTLPPTPQPALTKIIDSNLWLAIITNSDTGIPDTTLPQPNKGANRVTPNELTGSLESEKLLRILPGPNTISKTKPEDTARSPWDPPPPQQKTRLPESHTSSLSLLRSTTNTHSTKDEPTHPWEPPVSQPTISPSAKTHAKSGREKPVVHQPKEYPHKHRLPRTPVAPRTHKPNRITRREIPRPLWPTRIVIQEHTFCRATPKSCSIKQWVFDIASTRNHKACIVLLWQKSRLYGSFTNAEAFWKYNSRFQDRRCFYLINRSYEIKEEASILHFDVEWFTQDEDNSAPERLSIIKSAVAVIARNPITFHEERLSRQHLEHGWKNSFHLYTDLLFEHNAQGCMREFVENKVW